MKPVNAIIVLCLLLLALPHAAAGQHNHLPAGGTRTADDVPCPRTVKVTIKDFKYNEGRPVTINAGDSVVWFNADDMPHTATADDNEAQSFDTGILQPGQASEPIVFLAASGPAGFTYSCGVHPRMQGSVVVNAPPAPEGHSAGAAVGCNHHETLAEHSMVVTGNDPGGFFLHHISLFNDTNHYYHVTLEARLKDPAAQKAYREYRMKNGDSLVILDPELFLLPEIQNGKRTSFLAKFNHGKWESSIPGLQGVEVEIVRVIQFRRYDPNAAYPDRLTYQLYGNGKEVFLAHQVTAAPSFQQVIKLKEVPAFLTPEVIRASPLLVIPTKQLAASAQRTIRTAVLSNGTHILLSPPVGVLNPREPMKEDEELEVQIAGIGGTNKLVVGKLIYFDVRILNK
jgi:plastocyanin